MSEKMKELSKKLGTRSNDKIKEYISTVHKDFVTEPPKAILLEKHFLEYFLPHFKSVHKSDHTKPLTLKWMELAKGGYNEVMIINDDGKPLYNVPPLFKRPVINKDLALGDVGGKFNLRANRSHNDGVKFLSTALSDVPDKVVVDKTNTLANRWKKIFERYEPKTNTDKKSPPKKIKETKKNTIVDDNMFDYD